MYNAVILIIDDEQTYLDSITESLKSKKFKIVQAVNGEMGIMVAQKFMPDIIITDWEMPDMNGIEMIKKLKANEATHNIPVIMCTGIMTTSKNLDTALEAGAIDYIRKPVDAIELSARINSALKLSASFKRIKTQNEELQLLNNTKNKFFSIIAHDLRGPIGSMDSFLDVIIANLESNTREELLKNISLLKNSTRQTFSLLENLLTWARSQRDEIPYEPAWNNLRFIIDECVSIFKIKADAKKIRYISYLHQDLYCFFDAEMIRTILRNLINNATKYTRINSTIEISATKNEQNVVVSIKDTGIGINAKIKEKLFRIDSKMPSAEGTNGEKGTGLGLILCYEFIKKHNGNIWVESEPEKGSTFRFSLPFA